MSMLRKLSFAVGLFLIAGFSLFAQQGILKGVITDVETGEPMPFVNVVVKQNGEMISGAQTDMEGNYTVRNLPVGKYDIHATSIGYAEFVKKGVQVSATGFSTGGDIQMQSAATALEAVVIVDYKVPLIEKGSAESGQKLSTEDIQRMPSTSVEGILSTVGGVSYNDGGTGTARGEGQMVTYVNGVRKQGAVNIPKQAIGEIQVILGGTPARFGESMGGTTNITLQPPSNEFLGNLRYETSEPFNSLGSHRLDFYFTGPIYTKKFENGTQRSVIGYRLAGFTNYVMDPYFRGVKDRRYYMAKDDVQKRLDESPLVYDPVSGTVNYSALSLRKSDFEQVGRKPNLWGTSAYVEGGLDFRFSENAVLQVNGEFQFGTGKNGSAASFLLNNANNGNYTSNSYQIMADFTHKFPTSDSSSSLIRNFTYNFTVSYSRMFSESYDPEHKTDFFKYGHVGTFVTTQVPAYTLERFNLRGADVDARVQNGWYDSHVDFTPSSYNPGLSRYTEQLFTDPSFEPIRPLLYNRQNITALHGLYNGGRPESVYGMFNNVGVSTGAYSKSESQYIYVSARATAEIQGHQLEFGLQYDRGIHRGFSLSAASLWTIMRQEANQQILYRDLDNPRIDESGTIPTVTYDRKYDPNSHTAFDRNLRTSLGMAQNGVNWIDIDSYDPSIFSMDMFSPDELFNSGNSLISYYGYDHTGNRVTGKHGLDEFFNSSKRTLGAWEPIYMAGYFQDQFYFKDLIFNIGLRVDRFDGNQMVLKDPYLLYEAYTAAEVDGSYNQYGSHPSNIGGDYVVYVDDMTTLSDLQIRGYRRGDTWYDASGKEVSDPSQIAGGGGQPIPYRKGDLLETGFPKEISVNAFKDYEPQIVPMPRIAFSFPVSDESQFKASYDIIARRPVDGAWKANYQSYLFMTQQTNTLLANPDLKPERVTNYELGFQQILSKSSVIGISVYYKETRDLIQLMQYVGGDPNPNYYTYGNIDFKTTKGFTLSYDLRRSKNVRINANYTLQYADGTGLPQNTLVSLIRAGYPSLKMLSPISDDRRHEFKVDFDFRYGAGKDYNGPKTSRKVMGEDGIAKVKETRWLENFGFHVTAVAQSGRPYTKRYSHTQNTIVGSYNGARLPWIFNVDMQIEKGFDIKVGKKNTQLVAFLRASNVFNIRNVSGVYSVSGDPDDDGFLTDPETQTVIASEFDPQSYRDYYMLNLNNYYNYNRPRMIYIGVTYTF